VAGPGDKSRVQAEFLLRPARKLVIEILGGVGEGGEDEKLAVAGIERRAALALDDFAECLELGVARRAHLLRRREQRRQPVAVLDEVLPPADTVHVL
jgi:hypothetical protein